MSPNRFIVPRKLKLTADGQSVVFIKNPVERDEHVLMKAFLWGLYLPTYPDLAVEVRIGDRYKPDVVSIDAEQEILGVGMGVRFWGEAGAVGAGKIESLARRFPSTHFAIAKWGKDIRPLKAQVRDAIEGRGRTAPFDLIRFEDGDADRFIDANGHLTLSHEDVHWLQLT